MLIHLKNENFNEEIKQGKVLVDFYATWCGPCQMLSPIIEELANENSELKVIKIDVDEHEDIARTYAVMSIPTLLLFEDGNITNKNIGYMTKEDLIKWLN